MTHGPLVAGGIKDRRDAWALSAALTQSGVRASVSQAGALRVWLGELRFEFARDESEYILADPGADTVDAARDGVKALTHALEVIGARSRFEVYEGEQMTSYHHVNWPLATERAQ